MPVLQNITTRSDISFVVHSFYSKALKDDLIGFIFTDIAQLDLEHHLPRIVDFWDSVIFGAANYSGNPVLKHVALHHKSPLKENHFERWLTLWNQTIELYFVGEKAEEMKNKAKLMANLMLYKIKASEDSGFVQ